MFTTVDLFSYLNNFIKCAFYRSLLLLTGPWYSAFTLMRLCGGCSIKARSGNNRGKGKKDIPTIIGRYCISFEYLENRQRCRFILSTDRALLCFSPCQLEAINRELDLKARLLGSKYIAERPRLKLKTWPLLFISIFLKEKRFEHIFLIRKFSGNKRR